MTDDERTRLIRTASGEEKADLVIKNATVADVFGGTVTLYPRNPSSRIHSDSISPLNESYDASAESSCGRSGTRRMKCLNPWEPSDILIPPTPDMYHAPGKRKELWSRECPGRSFSHISQIVVAPLAFI